MQIRLVTYNVHRFVGRGHQRNVQRTAKVLEEIKPDIVALQEVDYFRSPEELEVLFHGGKFNMVIGPTIRSGDEHYGNVLLTRFPVGDERKINLSYPDREERGAIDVDIDCHGFTVRVIATHFGLLPVERRKQANILLQKISERSAAENHITLLMGDMNEWFLWGRPLRFIHNYFGSCPDLATYPAKLPIFSLDRIWCHPAELTTERKVHKSRRARQASDHLPLTAILNL